jgi:regulation of enolase protein 1 (concanavalin A-like superfamily)/fibronectin type 3 domain-containing protein
MDTSSFFPSGAAPQRRSRGLVKLLCGVVGLAPVLAFCAPPAAPTNVQAPFVSDTRVRVTWTDNSSDETAFQIIRADVLFSSSGGVVVGTTGANVTSFDDDTVRPGTRYYYWVAARRGAELSSNTPFVYVDVTTVASTASRVEAPTHAQTDGATADSLRLTWKDNSNDETRFDIFRQSGHNYAEWIASVPANTVSYRDTGLDPNTGYSYYVCAVRGGVFSAYAWNYGQTLPITAAGGWDSSYLMYSIPKPAPASGSPPNVTIQGGGDIWDGVDDCSYYYRTLAGDATIVTRVASLTNTNAWAKAGVMIRASLEAGSAHASMLLTAGANAIFEVRPTTYAGTQGTLGAWLSPPYWTKLTRVGNTFTGYISPDGATWTQVGTADLAFPATIYVGVAVSSHWSQFATGVFENLVASGRDAPPPPPTPAWPTDVQVGDITTSSAHLSWIDHADNEDGFKIYRWERSGPELLATVGANVTSFDDTGLPPDTHEQYYIKAFKGDQLSSTAGAFVYSTGGAAPAKPVGPLEMRPDSISATSVHLAWVDGSSDETQFVVERALTSAGKLPDPSAFSPIANLPANTISYLDYGLTPDTHYAYRVRALRGSVLSEAYGGMLVDTPKATNPPPPPPPPPSTWTGRDIGVTGSTGSDSDVPPTVTMNAGGTDIYGNADGFHSMFETITGDATIVAHVASMTNTHSWAKAGVMIRGTLDAGSANAAMVLSPDAPCSFQNRLTQGAATNTTTGAWVNPPYWVKLARTGDTFVGSVSADGAVWTEVSRVTLTLPAQVYIGLVASSHTTAAQTAVSFDHVGVTGSDSPPPPPPSTWTGRDIGATGSTGSDTGVPPTVTMNAGGTDIYGNADGFHSMFESVTGDATIVAHVASMTNTHQWAKAGVMIRGTLDVDSANAAMVLSPDAPCSFQNRLSKGAATNAITGAWVNPPYWVKLSRTGDTFVGSVSADGTAWTEVSRVTLTLPAQVYIGLVGSSHTTSAQTTVSFDHVEVTSASSPPPPPPPTPDWAQQSWPGATGSYTTDPTFSITATSGDIYDQQDSGVFVYQPWSGPGEFVARVDALGNSHPWAKGGFMLRASLAPGAGNAFLAIIAGQGAVFQHRANVASAATTTAGQDWVSAPGSWLKLVRGAGKITAYSSPDGTNWTLLGAVDDDLPTAIYAGFAVSSHNSAASTTATFSGFVWPE